MNIVFKKGSIQKDATFAKGEAVITFSSTETGLVIEGGIRRLIIEGKEGKVGARAAELLIRKIIKDARAAKLTTVHLSFDDLSARIKGIQLAALYEKIGTALTIAFFEFDIYKSEKRKTDIETIYLYSKKGGKKEEDLLKKGITIGEEINNCRALANTPGGEMTPELLAHAAEIAAENTNVHVTIFDKARIEKEGMGALLGVAKGSIAEPRFIIMEYWGGKRGEAPTVLVGKGVTFDTGGLNLKPSNAIYEMHMDMSGGAAVIHTLILAEKLKIKKNIIGLIPAAENMPSGSSYRPGDVLRSMSGKTIEIMDTDAEGRVILADGLTYAKKYKPKLVIDVATLTGAAVTALGKRANAIFSKNDALLAKLEKSGEEAADYVWPLPLWDEYEQDIKGTFGDISNYVSGKGGGAIQGAMFLYQFAKEFPAWVHIDMAPRMTLADDELLAKGASGSPVRLLIKFLEK